MAATSHFEEMVDDTSGGKRNFELLTHSNKMYLNIGGLNTEYDTAIQLELNIEQYKKLYDGIIRAGYQLAWLE